MNVSDKITSIIPTQLRPIYWDPFHPRRNPTPLAVAKPTQSPRNDVKVPVDPVRGNKVDISV